MRSDVKVQRPEAWEQSSIFEYLLPNSDYATFEFQLDFCSPFGFQVFRNEFIGVRLTAIDLVMSPDLNCCISKLEVIFNLPISHLIGTD